MNDDKVFVPHDVVDLLRQQERMVLQFEVERAKERAQTQWKQRLHEEKLEDFYRDKMDRLIQEIDQRRASENDLAQQLYQTQHALTEANNECGNLRTRVNNLEKIATNLDRLTRRAELFASRDQQEEIDLTKMKNDMIESEEKRTNTAINSYDGIHRTIALRKRKSPTRYDINGRRIPKGDESKKKDRD